MVKITRAAAKAAGLKRFFTGRPCKYGHTVERKVVSGNCLACHNTATKANYATNPEPRKAASRAWALEHPDRVRELGNLQSRKDKDKRRARNALYRRTHRGKVNAKAAKRRAAVLLRTPAWAELSAIQGLYIEAATLGMEVDHIYPLQGRLVSGLHVLSNLQLLTEAENCEKGNRYTP